MRAMPEYASRYTCTVILYRYITGTSGCAVEVADVARMCCNSQEYTYA